MPEEKTNVNDTQTYDARQVSEQIAVGEQKKPEVNVEADYEASKAFSVSEIDRTGAGAKAAAAASAPKFELHSASETKLQSEASGSDREKFRAMAQDVNPEAGEVSVTDEIVQKAIEKGTPGR